MEILHLATSLTNGAGKAARRINSSIIEAGGKSHLLTTGRVDGKLMEEENQVQISPISSVLSKVVTVFQSNVIEKSAFPLTPLSTQKLNMSKLDLKKYTVVNLHSTYNLLNVNSLRILEKFVNTLVITLHDERFYTGGCHNSLDCDRYLTDCHECPIASRLGKKAIENSFNSEITFLNQTKMQVAAIAPSEWIKEKASKSAKLGKFSITSIPNPIPENIYTQKTFKPNKFKNESKFTLGFIAAKIYSPFKGFISLIEALNLMGEEEISRYRIFVIGASQKQITFDKIEVLHFESSEDHEIAELIRAIDLLVVPSRGDNSPSVISEALMCGTKVIGSAIGGIPEMLNYDQNLIFDPDSPLDLLAKIRLNNRKYNRLCIESRARPIYSSNIVGKKYIKFYNELINKFAVN